MSVEQTHLLVVDKSMGNLVALELSSGQVAWTVEVGPGPHETVAIPPESSPSGTPLALVSMYATRGQCGQAVAVVDLVERSVIDRVSTQPQSMPHGLALVPGTSRVLVTLEADDSVLSFDLADPDERQVIATGQRLPHMVVAAPDGSAAFAANITGGAVTRIDLSDGTARSAHVGAGAEGIAVTQDGSQVWVGSNEEHEVHVFSTADLRPLDSFATCRVPIRVTRVSSELMAVTCLVDARVDLHNVESHELVRTVSLPEGSSPVGTLPTPDGRLLYVAATATGTIYEVAVATGEVLRTFDAGEEPDGMALVTLPE